jgi:hypothetical protein
MDKKQIAHGLAVAHMVGKDLPTEELVNEYKKKYDEILKYLKDMPPHETIVTDRIKLGL